MTSPREDERRRREAAQATEHEVEPGGQEVPPRDFNTPRPMGQLYIEHQKDRLINDAAAHGWVPLGRDPLILSRGEKQIEIAFNGGGIPNSIKWLRGDEFSSMRSTGYVDLNELYRWFSWKPEGDG